MWRSTTAAGQLESVALKLRRREGKGQVLKNGVVTVLYMIVESGAARPFVMVSDLRDCDFGQFALRRLGHAQVDHLLHGHPSCSVKRR